RVRRPAPVRAPRPPVSAKARAAGRARRARSGSGSALIGTCRLAGYRGSVKMTRIMPVKVDGLCREVPPMSQTRPVAVLGGVRIPFCRRNTAYAHVGNLGMSVRTLAALVERFGLHGQQLGEVAMGAALKLSRDWILGREAALSSGLSPLPPGITLQRACGTSLDSIITIANQIAVGQIHAGIGGGSDTTSDVPIVYGQKLRRRLLRAAGARTTKDKLGAFRGFRVRELKPDFPGVAEPRTGKSMGAH